MNPYPPSTPPNTQPQIPLLLARYTRYASYGCRTLGGLLFVASLVGMFVGEGEGESTGLGGAIFFIAFGEVLNFASRRLRSQLRLDIGTIAGMVFGGAGALMVIGGVIMVFDDPAGFALVAFGLVFVGVGYLAHRFMKMPAGKKAVPVATHGTTFQGPLGQQGTRTRTVLIHVEEDATEAEIEAARQQWNHERWQQRPDWVAGRIVEEGVRTGSLMYWAAGLWNVVAWGLILAYLRWGEPPWIFLIFPAAFAVAFTVLAVRTHLRRRKFGPSRFLPDDTPAIAGERLTGTIETGVEERHGPADGFRVRLVCLNRYEVRESKDSTRIRETVLWETEHRLNGHPYPSLPRRLAVPIDLALPLDQPSTTLDSEREGTVWKLEISAAVSGLDYAAAFRIPVFHRADDPTRSAPGSDTVDRRDSS